MDLKGHSSRFSDSSDELENQRVVKLPKKEGCHDVEEWWPQELERVLKKRNFEIQFLLDCEFIEVENELTTANYVGLSMVSENKKRPIVICLVTKDKIYVINPSAKEEILFLEQQLLRTDITFYTVDGMLDSDMLRTITLLRLQNQLDLVAADIYLTVAKRLPAVNPTRSHKPYVSFIHETVKPRQLDYQELVTKWLQVKIDFRCYKEEWDSLKSDPSSILGLNAIKKSCVLIRKLGKTMFKHHNKQRRLPSTSIFSMASASDEVRELFERQSDNSYDQLCLSLSGWSG